MEGEREEGVGGWLNKKGEQEETVEGRGRGPTLARPH